MKVFVQMWCELDPVLSPRVDRQKDALVAEKGDTLFRVSPIARRAVADAALFAQEIVAFCLGDEHRTSLRHALAGGAHEAIVLQCSEECISEFAHWLTDESMDILIGDRMVGLVAAQAGWAHLAGVEKLSIGCRGLNAIRNLERGNREQVTATLPAALRLHGGLRAPYISKARLAAVSEDRIRTQVLAGSFQPLIETGPLQPTRPRTKLGSNTAPARPISGKSRLDALMGMSGAVRAVKPEKRVKSTEELAEEFVRYLAHHRLLDNKGE